MEEDKQLKDNLEKDMALASDIAVPGDPHFDSFL
jgi:hypothetical protein